MQVKAGNIYYGKNKLTNLILALTDSDLDGNFVCMRTRLHQSNPGYFSINTPKVPMKNMAQVKEVFNVLTEIHVMSESNLFGIEKGTQVYDKAAALNTGDSYRYIDKNKQFEVFCWVYTRKPYTTSAQSNDLEMFALGINTQVLIPYVTGMVSTKEGIKAYEGQKAKNNLTQLRNMVLDNMDLAWWSINDNRPSNVSYIKQSKPDFEYKPAAEGSDLSEFKDILGEQYPDDFLRLVAGLDWARIGKSATKNPQVLTALKSVIEDMYAEYLIAKAQEPEPEPLPEPAKQEPPKPPADELGIFLNVHLTDELRRSMEAKFVSIPGEYGPLAQVIQWFDKQKPEGGLITLCVPKSNAVDLMGLVNLANDLNEYKTGYFAPVEMEVKDFQSKLPNAQVYTMPWIWTTDLADTIVQLKEFFRTQSNPEPPKPKADVQLIEEEIFDDESNTVGLLKAAYGNPNMAKVEIRKYEFKIYGKRMYLFSFGINDERLLPNLLTDIQRYKEQYVESLGPIAQDKYNTEVQEALGNDDFYQKVVELSQAFYNDGFADRNEIYMPAGFDEAFFDDLNDWIEENASPMPKRVTIPKTPRTRPAKKSKNIDEIANKYKDLDLDF